MTSTAIDLSAIRTDQTSYKGTFRALIGVYSTAEVDALIAGIGGGSVVWGDIGGTLSNQTDLQNALNAKANSSHTHSTAEVTGLDSALAAKASIAYVDAGLATKASSSHTHSTAEVTGLDTALSGKQATLVSGTNIKTINGVSVLGSGDIIVSGGIGGSTGATDNRVLRSDGTGGATAQASSVTIDDNGNVSGVGSLTVDSFGSGDSALVIETFTDPANGSVKAARLRTGTASRRLYIGNSSNKFYALNLSGITTLESFPNINNELTIMGTGTSYPVLNVYRTGAHANYANFITAQNASNYYEATISLGGASGAGGAFTVWPGVVSQTDYCRMEYNNGSPRIKTSRPTLGLDASSVVATGLVSVGTYTVGTLPSASSNAGSMAQVTDSSVTTFRSAVSGGGSSRVMVFSDGTNWVVV